MAGGAGRTETGLSADHLIAVGLDLLRRPRLLSSTETTHATMNASASRTKPAAHTGTREPIAQHGDPYRLREDDDSGCRDQADEAAPHCPLVVNPFQYIDRMRIGKLQDAAMPKVNPTRKAMFSFSNRIPDNTASRPSPSDDSRIREPPEPR